MAQSTNKLTGLIVYIIFGSVAVSIINTQMLTIEGDATNYSATEILLAGLVSTFFILGLVYQVAKKML